jgi:hypothetical protein
MPRRFKERLHMDPMLPFLAEERMRTLRRDGELLRLARSRARRRWRPVALSADHDARRDRHV